MPKGKETPQPRVRKDAEAPFNVRDFYKGGMVGTYRATIGKGDGNPDWHELSDYLLGIGTMVDFLTPPVIDKAAAFALCVELYAEEWARMQLGLPSQDYELLHSKRKPSRKEKRILATLGERQDLRQRSEKNRTILMNLVDIFSLYNPKWFPEGSPQRDPEHKKHNLKVGTLRIAQGLSGGKEFLELTSVTFGIEFTPEEIASLDRKDDTV